MLPLPSKEDQISSSYQRALTSNIKGVRNARFPRSNSTGKMLLGKHASKFSHEVFNLKEYNAS